MSSFIASCLSQLRCWWTPSSSAQLASAESDLLEDACVPSSLAKYIGKDGSRLRTLDLPGPTGAESLPPIVLFHGFGMGLAFWGRQLAEFQKYRRVIAVDLPGLGSSDRPSVSINTVQEAEDYFISTLESWREHMKIRRMVLVGHGLGAYIAAVYSLRHHKRVEHLFMLSAAGNRRATPPWDYVGSGDNTAGWQSIIRLCGGWLGKKLTHRLARIRYHGEPRRTIEHIGRYMYHLWARPSYAEAATALLLQLGSRWGRKPLVERLHRLKSPVTFLYGEHDAAAHAAADDILPRLSVPASVVLVPAAGAHAYLDNPARFNAVILSACGTGRARPPSRVAGGDDSAAVTSPDDNLDLFDPTAAAAAAAAFAAAVGEPAAATPEVMAAAAAAAAAANEAAAAVEPAARPRPPAVVLSRNPPDNLPAPAASRAGGDHFGQYRASAGRGDRLERAAAGEDVSLPAQRAGGVVAARLRAGADKPAAADEAAAGTEPVDCGVHYLF